MSESIRSTGSPDPRISNSSSTPLTSTLSMRPPRSSESGFSNQMREHDRYGGHSPRYKAVTPPARDAATRGESEEAFDLLMEADASGLLSRADLPLLGEVAYATGHLNVTVEAW